MHDTRNERISVIIFLLVLQSTLGIHGKINGEKTFTFKWICSESEFCKRANVESLTENEEVYPTIEVCRLICGKNSALWPKPEYVQITNRSLFVFNPITQMTVQFNKTCVDEMCRKIVNIFRENLRKKVHISNCDRGSNKLSITIDILTNERKLGWNTDESYTLTSNLTNDNRMDVYINAGNIFGARHGLETLSQLITSFPSDDSTCLTTMNGIKIKDSPAYTHRGLLIDTSRNYLSIKTIKKHIQAMASSKMNFLHWHITDSHSFPMETPTIPNMTLYGAYSPTKIYKYDDIKNLIEYALYRGVRIVLELDAPSHAGFGWQWGYEAGLGNLTVCLNDQPWRQACIQPPCGQLNPSNGNVYEVLQKIYQDIVGVLPWNDIIHMGGDELFLPCWNMTEEILRYIGNKPRTTQTFLDLWAEFQRKALERYDRASGTSSAKVILWTSHLTNPDVIENYLDKNRYVIQTWVPDTDDLPQQLIDKGYKLIISTKNAWYLDHGFWRTTNYYDWRTVYKNQIQENSNVLGGEVCMWGEYVDDLSVIGRTWPRAAAAAERLWSNPNLETQQVEARFYRHRERLVQRGIDADAIIPRWCYYNEGECY